MPTVMVEQNGVTVLAQNGNPVSVVVGGSNSFATLAGRLTYAQLPLDSGEWDPGLGKVITLPRAIYLTNDEGEWRHQITLQSNEPGSLRISDVGNMMTRGYSEVSDSLSSGNIHIWRGKGCLRIQKNIIPVYDEDDNFDHWSLENPASSGVDMAFEAEGWMVQGFSPGDTEKTQAWRSRYSGTQKRNISYLPLTIGLTEVNTSETVTGAVAGTCQLCITKETGTATLDPVTTRLWAIASAANWANGAPNYWAAHEFVLTDSTPPGESVRGRLSIHSENLDGSRHGLGLWAGGVAGPVLVATLGSDLSALFAGAVTATGGFVGALTGSASSVPASGLTGTTLASGVVTSSLTTIGTLEAGAVPAARVTAGAFGVGLYQFTVELTDPGATTGLLVNPIITASAANVVGTIRGLSFTAEAQSVDGRNFSSIMGLDGIAKLPGSSNATATDMRAANLQVRNEGTGTITRAIGLRVAQAVNSGGGAITTAVGIGISPQTVGTNNVSLLLANESGVTTMPSGSWGIYSYSADPSRLNGDLHRGSDRILSTRKTGWTTIPTGTLNRTTFVSNSVTLPELAARVAALIVDMHGSAGHGLIGA